MDLWLAVLIAAAALWALRRGTDKVRTNTRAWWGRTRQQLAEATPRAVHHTARGLAKGTVLLGHGVGRGMRAGWNEGWTRVADWLEVRRAAEQAQAVQFNPRVQIARAHRDRLVAELRELQRQPNTPPPAPAPPAPVTPTPTPAGHTAQKGITMTTTNHPLGLGEVHDLDTAMAAAKRWQQEAAAERETAETDLRDARAEHADAEAALNRARMQLAAMEVYAASLGALGFGQKVYGNVDACRESAHTRIKHQAARVEAAGEQERHAKQRLAAADVELAHANELVRALGTHVTVQEAASAAAGGMAQREAYGHGQRAGAIR